MKLRASLLALAVALAAPAFAQSPPQVQSLGNQDLFPVIPDGNVNAGTKYYTLPTLTQSLAAVNNHSFNVADYGASSFASAAVNNQAFANAFSDAAAVNGSVYIPCQPNAYNLTQNIAATILPKGAIAIEGDGHECVQLNFIGANGITLTKTDQFGSVLAHDFTITTTDTTGAYKALTLTNPNAVFYNTTLTGFGQDIVRNVFYRGADAYSTGQDYWGTGLNVLNDSYVSVDAGGYWGGIKTSSSVTSSGTTSLTWTASNLVAGTPIRVAPLANSSLPSGLDANRTYYVLAAGLTANSFEIATSIGGSAITVGASSGFTVSIVKGTAASVAGLASPASYAVVLNFNSFQVQTCDAGVYYGDWFQGMSITGGSNFSNCNKGVDTPATFVGTPDQLVIGDSQFATYVVGVNAPLIPELLIHHDAFLILDGTGIVFGQFGYAIDHNFIHTVPAAARGTGLNESYGSFVGGAVDHNIIYAMAQGILISAVGTTLPISNVAVTLLNMNTMSSNTDNYVVSDPNLTGVTIHHPGNFTAAGAFGGAHPVMPACANNIAGATVTVIDQNITTFGAAVNASSGGGFGTNNWGTALCGSNGYTFH